MKSKRSRNMEANGRSYFFTGYLDKLVKVKLVVVGDMSVGKTSLAVRFSKGTFDSMQKETVGGSFIVKSVDAKDRTVLFQIWDTAGQERYRSLVPMYLRDTQVAILIYDVTDLTSFQNVELWREELHKHAPQNAVLALVGNKNDMTEVKAVPTETAETYAKTHNMKFMETSAKTGQNVNKLFTELAEAVPNTQSIDDDIIQLGSTKQKGRCCHR